MVSYISDNVTVLSCSGRLVLGEDADTLRERVKKLLVEGHRIVVNLTELEHIDGVGLATVAGLHGLDNSRIKLVCSSLHLTGLFRRTKLDTVNRGRRLPECRDETCRRASRCFGLCPSSQAGNVFHT
jgi:anti-anti-sigma regulatory factor